MTLIVKKFQKDVVYLCQPCVKDSTYSASPFCNKLEAWLKFAKIPYQIEHTIKFGPNGKWPYIELNGKATGDSSEIIALLSDYFHKDLNSHLSAQELSVARGFQMMIEDHLFFSIAYYYWYDADIFCNQFMPALFHPLPSLFRSTLAYYFFRPPMCKRLDDHGVGKLPVELVKQGVENDLHALSTFLNEKKYFMGEKISTIDATVYGFLDNILYFKTPMTDSLNNYKNLTEYVTRIRTEFDYI